MRFLSLLLISTFFLGTLGLKINQHFCCGNLVAWEILLGQKPKDCSGKVPTEKKKCCEDKIQVLEIDDSTTGMKASLPDNTGFPMAGIPCSGLFVFSENPKKAPTNLRINGKAPPEWSFETPRFLLYRNIRV